MKNFEKLLRMLWPILKNWTILAHQREPRKGKTLDVLAEIIEQRKGRPNDAKTFRRSTRVRSRQQKKPEAKTRVKLILLFFLTFRYRFERNMTMVAAVVA